MRRRGALSACFPIAGTPPPSAAGVEASAEIAGQAAGTQEHDVTAPVDLMATASQGCLPSFVVAAYMAGMVLRSSRGTPSNAPAEAALVITGVGRVSLPGLLIAKIIVGVGRVSLPGLLIAKIIVGVGRRCLSRLPVSDVIGGVDRRCLSSLLIAKRIEKIL